MTEAMAEDNKDKLHIRLHVYDTEMSPDDMISMAKEIIESR